MQAVWQIAIGPNSSFWARPPPHRASIVTLVAFSCAPGKMLPKSLYGPRSFFSFLFCW
ncbi:unnamed protein product [Dibothriocephalus latus]|uniref:Uncharacterized protein n=1 Tax=Dibothriocephalus latus TaxID=60516 RepID=A0A3P7NI69_DIBLA|nr:unnamed protein product [Dibothriocephalus latus]